MNIVSRLLPIGLCAVAAFVVACGESTTEPASNVELIFSPESLQLTNSLSATVQIRNIGDAIGPIVIFGCPILSANGSEVNGAAVAVDPAAVPLVPANSSISVSIAVRFDLAQPPGVFSTCVEGEVLDDGTGLRLPVWLSFDRVVGTTPNSLVITQAPPQSRQGDVVQLNAEARTSSGELLDLPLSWKVVPATAGFVSGNGQFVGYASGDVSVVVESGEAADTAVVIVSPRNGLKGTFTVMSHGQDPCIFTSDLWVHGDFAYTGTAFGRCTEIGDDSRLHVWDITDPQFPVLIDSVLVGPGAVNDVKARQDGSLAVITHDGSLSNGISLLDLTDPAHPTIITNFTNGFESEGVHNVWVDGDYVYAASSAADEPLIVLDISIPTAPVIVGSFFGSGSFVHDVYVRDGLAFVSHWGAGLRILDVGNGVSGGTPANPIEIAMLGVSRPVHNAWYWPNAGYVFIGDETSGGKMRVIDVSDLRNPVEVASFWIAGDPPHNFWLDEERGILYAAWYGNGLRAIDVTGQLLGELDRQDREIANIQYAGASDCSPEFTNCTTATWAPQLHRGLVYVSDLFSGLWVLQPSF